MRISGQQKKGFVILLIDLDPETSVCLRYFSNIVPSIDANLFIVTILTSHENETKRVLYIEANAQYLALKINFDNT